jgi:hypothetical protein
VAIQMGEGLQEAQEQGVVHRDIKPANIMLTRKDRVKVMDFGLAYLAGRSKLTKSGTTVGTAVYMSPEQALGQAVDRRCDIWSLGVVLYEMLAGKPPFDDKHEQAIVYSIINEEPESLTARRTGLPIAIDRIVAKAIAKTPAERYQHVEDMLVDLRALRTRVEGKTAKALATPSATIGSRRWWARRVVGAALVAVGALGAWKWTHKNEQSGFPAGPLPLSSLEGQEQYPTFAPDATRVAFSWSGETGENVDIYTRRSWAGFDPPLPCSPVIRNRIRLFLSGNVWRRDSAESSQLEPSPAQFTRSRLARAERLGAPRDMGGGCWVN